MGASHSTDVNTLLLGLDGSGKTSIVARLTGDEVRTVLPTSGFTLSTVAVDGGGGGVLKLWDLGGERDLRGYWPAYFNKAHALIFVIDSTDRHRLAETASTLTMLLDDQELIGLPLLILANKQDAAGAIPAGELEELMHLGSIRDRVWTCVACSALRGSGIADGFKWLAAAHAEGVLLVGDVA